MIQGPIVGEFAGTFVMMVLGDGVVAACILKRTKAEGAGWLAITTGWAFAVLCGIFTANLFGSPAAYLNPAITLAFAIKGGDFSDSSNRRCVYRGYRGVAVLSTALGGDRGPEDQAGRLLYRARNSLLWL
jgi:hypothetical protein